MGQPELYRQRQSNSGVQTRTYQEWFRVEKLATCVCDFKTALTLSFVKKYVKNNTRTILALVEGVRTRRLDVFQGHPSKTEK